MKRLMLLVAVASAAIVAATASVASAATTAQCYKFSQLNLTNDAVISVTTTGLDYDLPFTGGKTTITQAIADTVLNSPYQPPNILFVGKSTNAANLGKSTYAYGLEGSAPAMEPGYAKYSLFKVAGDCSTPTPPIANAPQRNGVGMGADKPVARVGEQPGTFLNLTAGQTVPGVTLTWAIYVQGYGLMCQISDVFTYGGTPSAFHVSGTLPGTNYPYWIR